MDSWQGLGSVTLRSEMENTLTHATTQQHMLEDAHGMSQCHATTGESNNGRFVRKRRTDVQSYGTEVSLCSLYHGFKDVKSLKKRALRAKVWYRIETVNRAALDVVEQILRGKNQMLAARIKRSTVIQRIVKKAAQKVVDALCGVPQALPFKFRAMVEGTRIVRARIKIYRENEVIIWAPWIAEWLKRKDTIYYLGSTSIG